MNNQESVRNQEALAEINLSPQERKARRQVGRLVTALALSAATALAGQSEIRTAQDHLSAVQEQGQKTEQALEIGTAVMIESRPDGSVVEKDPADAADNTENQDRGGLLNNLTPTAEQRDQIANMTDAERQQAYEANQRPSPES